MVEAFLERNYAVFGVKMAEIMRRHGLTPAPPQGDTSGHDTAAALS